MADVIKAKSLYLGARGRGKVHGGLIELGRLRNRGKKPGKEGTIMQVHELVPEVDTQNHVARKGQAPRFQYILLYL